MEPSPPGASGFRCWPEYLVSAAACLILLGFLGSPGLWGKREQRAAAEALDTVENGHWLVARIQGRPRLEKPPLPRWISAALLSLAGRRSEILVRLPSALAGLATVALVYTLGRQMGGRFLGLASAVALVTTGMFISEHRQAGNDGMLGLFATSAIYLTWRRIEGPAGSRAWSLLFGAAMGLGFLCKGPIILMLVAATILPYLVCTGRLRSHTRRLLVPEAWLVFVGIAAGWPVAVLAGDSQVLGVWLTEMGQKTGLLPIGHRDREVLALTFPLLALPWPVLAIAGLLLPLSRQRRTEMPWSPGDVWLPWWWVVGNLTLFSAWAVAKPHYCVPCLPGLALLVGMAWIQLCTAARDASRAVFQHLARCLLALQWLLLVLAGVLVPLIGRRMLESAPWTGLGAVSGLLVSSALLSVWLWRCGRDALAPLPITVACAGGVVIGYALLAPSDDPRRSHAQLALQLDHLVPDHVRTLPFFHEIDEGLWFYLRSRRLQPVPGSQPRYSDSYDQFGSRYRPGLDTGSTQGASTRLLDLRKQCLLSWLRGQGPDEGYLLLRAALYDRLADDLNGLAVPIYREEGLGRNELVLLRVVAEPDAVSRSDRLSPSTILP